MGPELHPQNHLEKPGKPVHSYNPSTGEVEMGVPGVCWPVSLDKSVKSRFNERCCLKKHKVNNFQETTAKIDI